MLSRGSDVWREHRVEILLQRVARVPEAEGKRHNTLRLPVKRCRAHCLVEPSLAEQLVFRAQRPRSLRNTSKLEKCQRKDVDFQQRAAPGRTPVGCRADASPRFVPRSWSHIVLGISTAFSANAILKSRRIIQRKKNVIKKEKGSYRRVCCRVKKNYRR